MLGDPVTACNTNSVEVSGTVIPCETIIWAAGVQASPVANWLDAEQDRAGRTVVLPDLTIPQHDNIFVIGDTASVVDAQGESVPGIAPAAKQIGAYVGNAMLAQILLPTIPAYPLNQLLPMPALRPEVASADLNPNGAANETRT